MQALPLVYTSGISTSSTTGTFAAASVGGNFQTTPTFGVTENQTKAVSLLAQQYAPPKLNAEEEAMKAVKRTGILLLLSVASAFIFGSVEAVAVLAIGLSVLFFLAFLLALLQIDRGKREDKKNAEVYRNWERTFLCFTCGNLFIP